MAWMAPQYSDVEKPKTLSRSYGNIGEHGSGKLSTTRFCEGREDLCSKMSDTLCIYAKELTCGARRPLGLDDDESGCHISNLIGPLAYESQRTYDPGRNVREAQPQRLTKQRTRCPRPIRPLCPWFLADLRKSASRFGPSCRDCNTVSKTN